MKFYQVSIAVAALLASADVNAVKIINHGNNNQMTQMNAQINAGSKATIESKSRMYNEKFQELDQDREQVEKLMALNKKDGAVKLAKQMKDNIVRLADDILLEEQDCKDSKDLKQISPFVQKIAGKIGVVQDLEKRLDIMQNLDPLMSGILDKMKEVTDSSNLRELQLN